MSLPEPALAGLVLLGREDCSLCDDMQEALDELAQELSLPPLQHLDVDEDPVLLRRYGLDVPVLLLDGVKVCEHRLDAAELRRLLRGGRTPHRL